MVDYLILSLGLTILLVGGDMLVRGSVRLAARLAVPPLIIGLTIVALGTSAPELFLSVQAALGGSGGLAIGNVVGSNITNILLVLGLPGLMKKSPGHLDGLQRNVVVMIGFTALFMVMLASGELTRYNGLLLLVLLVLFLSAQLHSARATAEADIVHDYHQDLEHPPSGTGVIVAFLMIGFAALPLGADLTVRSATEIARSWNISDEVIGLTVLALGTSLPELATGIMAVRRNNASLAIGNVVGSSIFNIAAIMGITVVIAPIPVGHQIIAYDMWIMLAASLLVWFLVHFQIGIGKRVGGLMTAGYVVYIAQAFLF